MTTKQPPKPPKSSKTAARKIDSVKPHSAASKRRPKKVSKQPAKPAPQQPPETPVPTPRPIMAPGSKLVQKPSNPETVKPSASPRTPISAKSIHLRLVHIDPDRPPRPSRPKPSRHSYYNRRKRRPLYIFLTFLASVICVALLVFSGLKIYQWIQDNNATEEQQTAAEEASDIKEVSSEGEMVNPPDNKDDDYWKYINLPFYEVDFSELLAKNPDTVAFIHMNDTNVNYPVVQTSDNDYYLHHAFDGSYNDAGWVFMDYRSHLTPLSDNLIIYGHGRYNGTVFGSLRNAITPEWQQNPDNYVIWLSTPTENLLYQIFSIYPIEAEGYYLQENFASDAAKSTWLSTMQQRNTAPINTTVLPTDNILTLSTCKDDFGTRIVVQAKLIKRQPR